MDIDLVFKALADSTRRALLDQLYNKNGQTLTELCEQMDMSRQAVSQHLSILESADLVVIQWSGRKKLHYLNPMPIHEIYNRWIHKYEQNRLQALSDLKETLESKEEKDDE